MDAVKVAGEPCPGRHPSDGKRDIAYLISGFIGETDADRIFIGSRDNVSDAVVDSDEAIGEFTAEHVRYYLYLFAPGYLILFMHG